MCLRLALAIVALAVSGPAWAEQVDADNLNCRSAPTASAEVILQLQRGRRVSVAESDGVWARLESPSCWVVSHYLSDEGDLAFSSAFKAWGEGTYSTPLRPRVRSSSVAPLLSSPRTSRMGRPEARTRPSYGGSCPCSGSQICIGPRGGRYCITSGGNKRYGV